MANDSRPREYLEADFVVPLELSELWNWHCFESGATGLETLTETPDQQQVRAFFPAELKPEVDHLGDRFHQEFAHSGPFVQLLRSEVLPVQDWQASWRQYFPAIDVGTRLRIVPPWHQEAVPAGRLHLIIDPGQGFGTGHHESTALVLELMEQHLATCATPPERLVDVGVGSGILSLAACLLGVPQAEGVDLAPEAIAEVPRNAELNSLPNRLQAHLGGPEVLTAPAPLVVANMLWHELRSVRPDLTRLTQPGGFLICGGLLHEQAEAFAQELATDGFQVVRVQTRNEWTGLLLQHPQ